MAIRGHGGLVFYDIYDGSTLSITGGPGKIQAHMKKDNVGEEMSDLFSNTVDMGDFVEVRGKFFTTKRGEKSIDVSEWKMLAKGLLPLPDKWSGLQDIEEKSRKRYLDLLMDEESKKRFIIRSKIVSEMRRYLEENKYLEVETPVLQALAGGATAKPFMTHHNALNIDLYLRIAPELYLKKLLVGGFLRVYEIGKNFRNEGIDATHNPEFTMLEFYEAYSDAAKQMVFVEEMLKIIVKKVLGVSEIIFGENKIDFFKKFTVVSFLDLLKQFAGISDPQSATREDFSLKAKELDIKVESFDTKEKIADNIYKKACRPNLIQPTFIVNYPVDFLPLAKKKEKDKNFVDAFQLVVGGMEFVKAFSELNDPIDQRERFKKEEESLKAGNEEAQPADEDYLETMEYGMPPAGGVGIGIDRLAMLLTNTPNARDVILFPLMRPKE